MTVVEKYYVRAMEHLNEARQAMECLGSASGDWTAKTMLDMDFDSLEKSCRQFARCQAGVGVPSLRRTGVFTL